MQAQILLMLGRNWSILKPWGLMRIFLDNVVNSQDIREGKADIATIGLETPDEKTFVVHLEQRNLLFIGGVDWLVSASKTVLC